MSWCEHDCARPRRKFLVANKKHVLALDHIEELVLVRMDVSRSVERIYLLDDRECPPGCLRTGLDEEDCTREGQALASGRVEVVAV